MLACAGINSFLPRKAGMGRPCCRTSEVHSTSPGERLNIYISVRYIYLVCYIYFGASIYIWCVIFVFFFAINRNFFLFLDSDVTGARKKNTSTCFSCK